MNRARFSEQQAKAERYWRRKKEVVAMARSDSAFWEALRTWELEHKDEPLPMTPPAPPWPRNPGQTGLGGWTVYAPLNPQEVRGDVPVDPVFVDFVARVREPDDALTVRDIVCTLRVAMRAELGFDGLA